MENGIFDKFVMECKEYWVKSYGLLRERNIVLYPAGRYAQMIIKSWNANFMEENIIAVCDSNIESGALCGIPIRKFEDVVEKYSDITVIICTARYQKEIEEKVKQYGVNIFIPTKFLSFIDIEIMNRYVFHVSPKGSIDLRDFFGFYTENMIKKIENTFFMYDDRESIDILKDRVEFFQTGNLSILEKIPVAKQEYFDKKYFEVNEEEVYLDCGAYDGDSVESFINYTQGKYKKILAFEVDKANISTFQNKMKMYNWHDCHIVPYAITDEHKMLKFSISGDMSSHEADTGECIQGVALDEYLEEKCTILKMDIEGSELQALKGARKIITELKPNLVICVYHRPDDLYAIPEFIHELVPEYRFKIRQHAYSPFETVLYATVTK